MSDEYVVTVEIRTIVEDPQVLLAAAVAAGARIPDDFPLEGRIRMALETLNSPLPAVPGTRQPAHTWTSKVTARQQAHVD
jgi:hypothetical protein